MNYSNRRTPSSNVVCITPPPGSTPFLVRNLAEALSLLFMRNFVSPRPRIASPALLEKCLSSSAFAYRKSLKPLRRREFLPHTRLAKLGFQLVSYKRAFPQCLLSLDAKNSVGQSKYTFTI